MEYFKIIKGDSPLIGAAIHCGHLVRNEIKDKFSISDDERLREEDPFTDKFIEFAPAKIIVNTSRFEFDLNRPEDKAVYLKPEDAWGLKIWNEIPSRNNIDDSLLSYKKFYEEIRTMIKDYVSRYKKIFIYDVHSYNHMRNGPDGAAGDPSKNPDVNIGTGNIDSIYWKDLINDFINDLKEFDFKGAKPDIRENIKFKGGYFSKWINENFGNDVCVLSVEFKKTFMNEWTGEVYKDKVELINNALTSTMPGVLSNLK
ncbi:MAG: N-formylglutamate amidohydrolase [Bacteroidota bacterium]|nr:N-formylglutamate amidohydrolase [Bacteroidota bacterium]